MPDAALSPLLVKIVPCLSDNFAYLLHDAESGATALIDAPEAAPIMAALQAEGWKLSHLFLTHHHDDHVQGVAELRDNYEVELIGAEADAHRLPELDTAVQPGDVIDFAGRSVQVIDAPGHTVGHVAFYMPQEAMLFSGDALFALGCGRLFEGTPAQAWETLTRFAALPGDTKVYFGHEYTLANAEFSLDIEPGNALLRQRMRGVIATLRAGGLTTPTTIDDEKATNVFMRADSPEVQATVGKQGAPLVEVFTEVRERKNRG